MRFFENQDRARRNTLLLVALFSAAVLGITLAMDLAVYLALSSQQMATPDFWRWLTGQDGLLCSALAILVMTAGSAYRFFALAGGGARVAQMVGARAIAPASTQPDERRFINVVEEMAVASGLPMPQLFVMEQETAINAFVAGYEPGEAVLVVTRGTLDQLTRDELQGVIGHEFSHIFNGDMRLNVRLIALLAGILLIGQIGQFLMRSGTARSSRRRSKEGSSLAVIGVALAIIGYAGLFFGRLIKAAISRQREFLADASAVQFTRNPEGIAGALYKISLNSHQGRLVHTRHAEDLNHLCFGESVSMNLQGWLASHPPIEARIQALDASLLARMRGRYGRNGNSKTNPPTTPGHNAPSNNLSNNNLSNNNLSNNNLSNNNLSDNNLSDNNLSDNTSAASELASGMLTSQLSYNSPNPGFLEASPSQPTKRLSEQVGVVTRVNEDYASQLLRGLPEAFRETLHTIRGAVHLCYALVAADLSGDLRKEQLQALPRQGDLGLEPAKLHHMETQLRAQGAAFRFPALEIALPALRQLSPEKRQELRQHMRTLALADQKLPLFQFALLSFLERHLGAEAGMARTSQHRSYQSIEEALKALLWLVARTCSPERVHATHLYHQALEAFPLENTLPTAKATPDQLLEHLKTLSRLTPLLKPAILDACGDCVLADGKVAVAEYELLRLIADYLDCPLPPLPAAFPTQATG